MKIWPNPTHFYEYSKSPGELWYGAFQSLNRANPLSHTHHSLMAHCDQQRFNRSISQILFPTVMGVTPMYEFVDGFNRSIAQILFPTSKARSSERIQSVCFNRSIAQILFHTAEQPALAPDMLVKFQSLNRANPLSHLRQSARR